MQPPKTLSEEISRMQAAEGMTPAARPPVMLAVVTVRYLESFEHGIARWTGDPTKAGIFEGGLADVVSNILEADGVRLRQLPITK